MNKSSRDQVLFTYLSEKSVSFSLNPKYSDFLSNHALLDNLVGTLVKYGISGKIEPYLAENWHEALNGMSWTFKLREGLQCEDGTKITADSYVENLKRQLKEYSKSGNVLDFQFLRGWKSFAEGQSASITGLYATSSNEVVFDFSKKPEDLLEFLRMVYFGYWCPSNFSKGNWTNDHFIVSSGAFRLVSYDSDGTVTIRKRDSWFSVSKETPAEIIFQSRNFASAVLSESNARYRKLPHLIYGTKNNHQVPDKYGIIDAPPTLLTALVLSPYKKGVFQDDRNRRIFLGKIRERLSKATLADFGFSVANALYPVTEGIVQYSQPVENSKELATTKYSHQKITVALSGALKPEAQEYIKSLIIYGLGNFSHLAHFRNVDTSEPDWLDKVNSNEFYDIRIDSVDVGGQVLNMINRMMFCSKLGVSFPDPSGRICKLVDEQDKIQGPVPESYIRSFNSIIIDDASVIPLYHIGNRLIYTDDFDLKSISPIPNDIRFDLLRLKK